MDNLLFIDVETTGLTPDDKIVQVAYQLGNTDIKKQLFKPSCEMGLEAMAVNHITAKMVQDCEDFAGSNMMKDLESIFVDNIFVAHNAKFDIDMIESYGVKVGKHICTFKVANFLEDLPRYSIQFLRYYYGVDVDVIPHTADGDVIVLKEVFDKLFNKMKEKYPDPIQKMIEISSVPLLFRRLPFGKYKGMLIDEVARNDINYIIWPLGEKQKEGDENWIYTLKHYLN